MYKIIWNTLRFSPAVLGATLVATSAAMATDGQLAEPVNQMAVVTSSTTVPTMDVNANELLAQLPTSTINNNSTVQNTTTIKDINRYMREGRNLRQPNRGINMQNTNKGQVTSVSQLSDVQPTDWAFQALQSLVERYGCIAGYPDGTFKGNRSLTRYEFAAGVNACLDRITELLQAALEDTVSKEDLEVVEKLQEEFAAELAVLRGRVDALEARTAELEVNQFSTTTKLTGEAILALTDDISDQVSDSNSDGSGDAQTVFQYRVRLNFNTSFTGKDLLLTRLQVGNAQRFRPGVADAEGIQTFNVFGDTSGEVDLDKLLYKFPINDRFRMTVAANRGSWDDFVPTVNPYMEDYDGGSGSLSAFGQRNPIYRLGGGAGVGLSYDFGCADRADCAFGPTNFSLGYLAANASNAQEGSGLFNGDYSALAQLTLNAGNNLQFGLTYNHGYFGPGNFGFDNGQSNGLSKWRDGDYYNSFNAGFTGTGQANTLYGLNSGLNNRMPGSANVASPVEANSYGLEMSWRVSPGFVLSGWGGFTDANLKSVSYQTYGAVDTNGDGINDGNGYREEKTDGEAEIWYYGLALSFPNLGRPGSLGGLVVGRQPYLGGLDIEGGLDTGLTTDDSWHFEAFYKYQLNDNISITPGVIWVTNPNQNSNNDDTVIGTLRTTFQF